MSTRLLLRAYQQTTGNDSLTLVTAFLIDFSSHFPRTLASPRCPNGLLAHASPPSFKVEVDDVAVQSDNSCESLSNPNVAFDMIR